MDLFIFFLFAIIALFFNGILFTQVLRIMWIEELSKVRKGDFSPRKRNWRVIGLVILANLVLLGLFGFILYAI